MNKKVTFEEALKIAFDVRNIMMAEYQGTEYSVTMHEMMSLFMLSNKWNCKAKLSDIKADIKRHHSLEDFKKIEVMLAKKFTALEEAGFIQRIKCEEDKRETFIKVTPEGKKLVDKFLKHAQERWEGEI